MTYPHPLASLAQADVLLLAADLLNHPARLGPGDVAIAPDDLQAILAQAGWSGDAPLREAIQDALREAGSVDRQAWATEHARLFDAATLCPANESAFLRRDKGAILADLAGFYTAFGFAHERASGEKCDHLRTQLHFVAMLLVMLHHAERQHQPERAQVAAAALADLHADHLGLWLGTFCDQLGAVTVLPLYAHLADVLRRTWRAICRSRQMPAMPAGAGVGPYEPTDATPYECGMAGGEGASAAGAISVPLTVDGSPSTPLINTTCG